MLQTELILISQYNNGNHYNYNDYNYNYKNDYNSKSAFLISTQMAVVYVMFNEIIYYAINIKQLNNKLLFYLHAEIDNC